MRGLGWRAQVYVNSGGLEITATHKNVNEDIRDEGDVRGNTHTHTHRGSRGGPGCENRPGQCSIEGRKTIKPTDAVLLAAFF